VATDGTNVNMSGFIAGPGTKFSGCGPAGLSPILPGFLVSQPAAVSLVSLNEFQQGSFDAYSLSAAPRSYTPSGDPDSSPGLGAPGLLTLGQGVTVQGGTTPSKLTVNGTVVIDSGGRLTCGTPPPSQPVVTAYGYDATSGPSAFQTGCATGTPTTTQPDVLDPYANLVPSYQSQQFPALPKISSIPGGACEPGEYTIPFNCTTLLPGVYVLDKGLGTTSLNLASDSAGGVLLYLPGNASFRMSGSQTINLPPLTADQSAQYLGSSALQGISVWQDQGDSAAASLGTSGSSLGGLYFPGANVTIDGTGGTIPNVTSGRVIAQSIALINSANMLIQP
jgi:hypothetical protein